MSYLIDDFTEFGHVRTHRTRPLKYIHSDSILYWYDRGTYLETTKETQPY
ncbi:hypothetical protein [Spirosoma sp.]